MSQNGYTGCNVFPVYDTAALPQDDLRPAGLRRGYVALRSFHTLSASCVTVHGMLRYGPLGRGLGAQASCDWLIAVCGKWLNDNACENFESKFIEFRVHAHLSCLSRRPKSNVFPVHATPPPIPQDDLRPAGLRRPAVSPSVGGQSRRRRQLVPDGRSQYAGGEARHRAAVHIASDPVRPVLSEDSRSPVRVAGDDANNGPTHKALSCKVRPGAEWGAGGVHGETWCFTLPCLSTEWQALTTIQVTRTRT